MSVFPHLPGAQVRLTMNSSHDADEIRRQMRDIRREVGRDVEVLRNRAHNYASWRYHWRNHPWICLGTVAALGFIAVPRRTQVLARDPAVLAALATQRRLVVDDQPQPSAAKTFAGDALAMVVRAMLRGTMTYFEKNGSRILSDLWTRKNQTQ
jgi:hypothetical protein